MNRRRLLYYTDTAYNLFLKLQEDTKQLIQFDKENDEVEDWGFDVGVLKDWIERIQDLQTKEFYLRRWKDYVYLSKKKPVNKTPIYALVKVCLLIFFNFFF